MDALLDYGTTCVQLFSALPLVLAARGRAWPRSLLSSPVALRVCLCLCLCLPVVHRSSGSPVRAPAPKHNPNASPSTVLAVTGDAGGSSSAPDTVSYTHLTLPTTPYV